MQRGTPVTVTAQHPALHFARLWTELDSDGLSCGRETLFVFLTQSVMSRELHDEGRRGTRSRHQPRRHVNRKCGGVMIQVLSFARMSDKDTRTFSADGRSREPHQHLEITRQLRLGEAKIVATLLRDTRQSSSGSGRSGRRAQPIDSRSRLTDAAWTPV